MQPPAFLRKVVATVFITLLLASVLWVPAPHVSVAQGSDDGLVRVYNSQTGALNYISIPPERASTYTATTARQALTTFTPFAKEFGISDLNQQLDYLTTAKNKLGLVSYRYQQVKDGVPVFGGELRMVYNAKNQLTAISGETASEIRLSTIPKNDSATAAQQALDYVARQTGVAIAYLKISKPELMIYDSSLIGPHVQPQELVWHFEVRSINGAPIRYLVLVNAHLDGISLGFNQVDTRIGSSAAMPLGATLPVPPTSNPRWLPAFNGSSITYDSNNTSSYGGTGASTIACSDTQPTIVDLIGVNSCDGTGAPATDANASQYFALELFDYYDFYHNRNSIDDAGMTMLSNVRWTPNGGLYDNAFWDGEQMTYGNAGFQPTDDIVGHEMTHGVTEYTSNLFYYYESGAINEAISDIFGEYFDQLNGTNSRGNGADGIAVASDPNAWDMGEDLESTGAFRDMDNPPTFGDPDRMRSPNYWTSGSDEGGVHINSGIANKAAFLMVAGGTFNGQTITRLGTNLKSSLILASNIWYGVQFILTTGSDYQVLDQALVTACNNLVGVTVPGTNAKLTASDCVEVSQVTDATEMHLEPSFAGFSPEAALNCNVGTRTMQNMFFQDFETSMGGFSFVTLAGTRNWQRNRDYVANGNYALWGNDPLSSDNYARLASAITLTGGSEYYLYFKHAYGFEAPNYDGGTLEYSTNGGGTWARAGVFFKDGRGFNGAIRNTTLNAFLRESHGFNSSRYNLTSLAGQSVIFRWRIKTDNQGTDLGWILDDVRIYRCV